jgi:hypothetical protein
LFQTVRSIAIELRLGWLGPKRSILKLVSRTRQAACRSEGHLVLTAVRAIPPGDGPVLRFAASAKPEIPGLAAAPVRVFALPNAWTRARGKRERGALSARTSLGVVGAFPRQEDDQRVGPKQADLPEVVLEPTMKRRKKYYSPSLWRSTSAILPSGLDLRIAMCGCRSSWVT